MKVFFYVVVAFILFGFIDSAIAVDGFVAYRSNTGADTLNSPKIRYWNNTADSGNGSWSSEIQLSSAGSPVRYLAMKQSPTDSKIILVTSSDDGWLDGYVCMKFCDNASNWNYTSNFGNVSLTSNQRGFDVAFETQSGDALIVYGLNEVNVARDLAYKILLANGTTFAGLTENYLNDNVHATNVQYMWIMMDSDPVATSNEIIMGAFDDTNNDFNTWVWTGAAFGAINSITDAATATTNREAHAIKYAADGSVGMVASGDGGAGNIIFEYWNGAAWTAIASADIDAADGNDIQWMSMKADPNSNDLQLVIQDSGSDLHTDYWNGAVWALTPNIDTTVDVATARTADFSWLNDGTGRLVWDTDAALTTLSQRVCNPNCGAPTTTFSTYVGTGAWVTLLRNPTVSEIVKFLGFRLNNAFDIGSFRYNGSVYTNYGDNVLTADTTVTTYEAFAFDYRRDTRVPDVTFISPSSNNVLTTINTIFVNLTSNEYLAYAILEWNGTNYTMNGSDLNWNYSIADLTEGLYTYKVFSVDWAGNTNVSGTRNWTLNYPPNITLITPLNNTLNNYSRNTTFYYNVSDAIDNISLCSLIIDGVIVANTTVSPVLKNITQNFTKTLVNGQHNWSIWCNDTRNLDSTSEMRNITALIEITVYSILLDDDMTPYGEIILNAGATRYVNCSVVVGDPDGPSFINNASAKLYYYLNYSSNSDNNNTHYTNTNCTLTNTTSINKTFNCGFDVWYYANNGTWICNITVSNPNSSYFNISTLVQPLYAVNLTDGLDFGSAESGKPSYNVSANITNFGNMQVNVTLQGYAIAIGDNVGMNCSDDTNITITNIRFSTNNTANFSQKTQMNGSIQPLNFKINKQINSTQIFNTTYWQITPDPGSIERLCYGYIIFTAQAS